MSIRDQVKKGGGIFDCIEVHSQMTHQLIDKFYDIYNAYPDEWKLEIRKHIPSGLPVEVYVGIFHIQILLCSWHEVSEKMLLTISIINARIGYILRDMSPAAKSRFCTLVNQLGKFKSEPAPAQKDIEQAEQTEAKG